MGSSNPGSEHTTSMSREGLKIPDHDAAVELYISNRALHNKLRDGNTWATEHVTPPLENKNTIFQRADYCATTISEKMMLLRRESQGENIIPNCVAARAYARRM